MNSCYTLPLVKLPVKKNQEAVAEKYIKKNKRYLYISISRYGILGTGAKHITTDSAGRKKETYVYKRSNCVSDGHTIDHSKTIEYDENGKKVRKTKTKTIEEGWTLGGHKVKTIEFDSAGKRHVSWNNRSLWKFSKQEKIKKIAQNILNFFL